MKFLKTFILKKNLNALKNFKARHVIIKCTQNNLLSHFQIFDKKITVKSTIAIGMNVESVISFHRRDIKCIKRLKLWGLLGKIYAWLLRLFRNWCMVRKLRVWRKIALKMFYEVLWRMYLVAKTFYEHKNHFIIHFADEVEDSLESRISFLTFSCKATFSLLSFFE